MFQSKQNSNNRTSKLQNISIAFKKLLDRAAVRMHSSISPNYASKANSTSLQHSPFLKNRKYSFSISKNRRASFQIQSNPQIRNKQITLKFSSCQKSNKMSCLAKNHEKKCNSQCSMQRSNELYNKILSYNQLLVTKTYILQDISSLKSSKNVKSKRYFNQSRRSPIFSKTYQSNIIDSQNYESRIKKCQRQRLFINRAKQEQQLNKLKQLRVGRGEIEPWETQKHEQYCFISQ